MTAKKYAISNPSAAIALRYGANVSRGIGKSEELLNEYRRTYGPLECDLVARGNKKATSGPSVRGRK